MKLSRKLIAAVLAIFLPALNANASFISGVGATTSDAALAGGTVIDFEGMANATYAAGVGLTVGDVTFSANDNHMNIDNTYQGYNQSGTYLDNGTYGDNGFSSVTFSFAGTTDAFGFTWGMAEPFASWVLTAYDSSNSVLESYALPSTSTSSLGEFFGIATAGISYATLAWGGDYDWVAIDNFTYQASTSVPEPSTLLLLGAGFLGLGFAGRKKIRK